MGKCLNAHTIRTLGTGSDCPGKQGKQKTLCRRTTTLKDDMLGVYMVARLHSTKSGNCKSCGSFGKLLDVWSLVQKKNLLKMSIRSSTFGNCSCLQQNCQHKEACSKRRSWSTSTSSTNTHSTCAPHCILGIPRYFQKFLPKESNLHKDNIILWPDHSIVKEEATDEQRRRADNSRSVLHK